MNMAALRSLSFLIFFVATSSFLGIGQGQSVDHNVLKFGAIGDGNADDSAAFLAAFRRACGTRGAIQTVNVPAGKTYSLKPLILAGPCQAKRIEVLINGNIVAPSTVGEWGGCKSGFLLGFENINGLNVKGSGVIDGKGSIWWTKSIGCAAPTVINFNKCDNLNLYGFTSKDSPRGHLSIVGCTGVRASNIHIIAPGDSPNTDGIDISHSSQIDIRDSFIGTGDDCIAINGGSSLINITNVACGPGHGISVGSLGKDGVDDRVEQVHVRGCTFTKTQNAARIKTWMGGAGYARTISFQQITLVASGNPIIIDQKYCNGANGCPAKPGAVKVSDITFSGFKGTSAVEEAITLDCADLGCTNIILNHVNLKPAVPGMQLRALCNNAYGTSSFTTPHVPCLTNH